MAAKKSDKPLPNGKWSNRAETLDKVRCFKPYYGNMSLKRR